MEKESLERLLGQGESVERIAKRFGKDPSTVSYWMKKYGLTSPYAEKHAAKGGIDREQLESLVQAGLSIAEIASAVERSKATVRHWLRRYELQTNNGGGRLPRVRTAKESGQLVVTMVCPQHGETDFCHPCALEFHHLDPALKRMSLTAGGIGYALDTLREEAQKCVLLCSNCHAEVENGLAVLSLELMPIPGSRQVDDPG